MRSSLAAALALVLTATLVPGALAQTDVAEPDGAQTDVAQTDVAQPDVAEPDQPSGEQIAPALPDEHLDPEFGLITSDPQDVATTEPTVVTDLTTMPAAEPNAEVYPMPASGAYTVTGGGWGHRIGMSQYGAHGAGLAGLNHKQILSFYYPGTVLETWDTAMIRIGITIDNDGVTRVDHRAGLAVSHGTGGTTYALPTRDQWRVRATTTNPSSCVLEGRNSAGTWTAYKPSGMPSGCPITFSSATEGTVDLYLPNGSRRIYRGQITAHHRGTTSNLATVNRLPMQHYLRSVVSIEMSPYFHTQALRAQAVAARTYAERGVNGTGYYDTCDTTSCQAYRGRGARQSDGGITSYEYAENTAAVDATKGQVLTYQFPNGKGLATTMYAASTGGQTIPGGAGHPYLSAHPDPYDDTSLNTRHRWTAQLTASSLEARYDIHDVTRVQVLQRDGYGLWGGRILSAKVEGYTASGNYTYADASGIGLYLARPWPAWNTGLSSDYFTFGDPGTEPPAGEVTRIAGSDRWDTARKVSDQWSPGVSVAYLVNGEDYPDALAASARAGVYDAPVLLVKKDSVPADTQAALTRLKPGRLVIVGGTGSVSTATETKLRAYTTGTMERVGGSNRYATAANLASYYASGQSRVYLASGENFPDALTAAALAGKQHAPLLLTTRGQLGSAARQQLDRLNPGQVVVLGGTAGISNSVAGQAGAYATNGYRRVSGADRYGTAAQVALEFPGAASSTVVASGQTFADALVGAALAGRRGVPVVLTQQNRIPTGAVTALQHLDPVDIDVLGGTSSVSNATLAALEQYLR